MLIRRERPTDVDAIDEVHRQAFAPHAEPGAEPIEVGLVHALRADDGWVPALSLVADDDGRVLGHVVATMGVLDGRPAPGLGPLGVLPERQGDGVGLALMHAVLGAADALDHPVVVLLGDVGYYQRFGFVPASTLGIEAPDATWGDHFQARPLEGFRAGAVGAYRYAAPFDEL